MLEHGHVRKHTHIVGNSCYTASNGMCMQGVQLLQTQKFIAFHSTCTSYLAPIPGVAASRAARKTAAIRDSILEAAERLKGSAGLAEFKTHVQVQDTQIVSLSKAVGRCHEVGRVIG